MTSFRSQNTRVPFSVRCQGHIYIEGEENSQSILTNIGLFGGGGGRFDESGVEDDVSARIDGVGGLLSLFVEEGNMGNENCGRRTSATRMNYKDK